MQVLEAASCSGMGDVMSGLVAAAAAVRLAPLFLSVDSVKWLSQQNRLCWDSSPERCI